MWSLIILAYLVELGAVLGVFGRLPVQLPTELLFWVPVHLAACVVFAFAVAARVRRADRGGMTVMLFLFAAAVPPFGIVIASSMALMIRRTGRRGVFDELSDYVRMKPSAAGAVARLGEEVIENDLMTQPIVDLLSDRDRVMTKGAIDRLAMRNDAEAVKIIRGFLGSDDDALRLHASATLLKIENRLNDAIFEARGGTERVPASAESRVALARAYIDFCNSGLLDDATKRHYMTLAAGEYQTALRYNPQYAAAVAGLGRVQIDMGMGAEAVRMLEQAVLSNPDDAGLRLLLGEAYFGMGRFADVRSLLRSGPARRPEAEDEAETLIGWWTQSEGKS